VIVVVSVLTAVFLVLANLEVIDDTFILPSCREHPQKSEDKNTEELQGRDACSFAHVCMIKNSSSNILLKSSLGYLSGPGTLPGFRQYTTCFAIVGLVSALRNLHALIFSFGLVIGSSAALLFLYRARNMSR